MTIHMENIEFKEFTNEENYKPSKRQTLKHLTNICNAFVHNKKKLSTILNM